MFKFFKDNILFFILVPLSGVCLIYAYATFITDLVLTDFHYWGFPDWLWWYKNKTYYFAVMIPLITVLSYFFIKGTLTIKTNRAIAAVYLLVPLGIAAFFWIYVSIHAHP
ncbi:MAG: hypothetical protein LBL47_04780 [Lactobacillus sp.]|jgi:hypothetical protein|nr:hypothetical protein [Lactobacillus sp.]